MTLFTPTRGAMSDSTSISSCQRQSQKPGHLALCPRISPVLRGTNTLIHTLTNTRVGFPPFSSRLPLAPSHHARLQHDRHDNAWVLFCRDQVVSAVDGSKGSTPEWLDDVLQWVKKKGGRVNSISPVVLDDATRALVDAARSDEYNPVQWTRAGPDGAATVLMASQDVVEQELVLIVPREAMFSLGAAFSDPDIGSILKALADAKKEDDGFVDITVDPNEVPEEDPDQEPYLEPGEVLAIYLLHEQAKGDASAWAPYIKSLPPKHVSSVFWSDEALEMVENTPLGTVTAVRRAALDRRYKVVQAALLNGEHASLFPASSYSSEQWKWAMATVWERVMSVTLEDEDGVDEYSEPALVPLYELLPAHSNPDFVNTDVLNEASQLAVQSESALEMGQVLFQLISNADNTELCVDRGFARALNPSDAVLLPLKLDEEDEQYERRKEILRVAGIAPDKSHLFRFRRGVASGEMLVMLRVMVLDGKEFDAEKMVANGGMASFRNEKGIWNRITSIVRKQGRSWATTLPEDQVMFADDNQWDSLSWDQQRALHYCLSFKAAVDDVFSNIMEVKSALMAQAEQLFPNEF